MWNNEPQRVILSLQQRPFPYSQLLLEQYVLHLSQTRIGSNFCIQKITKKINFQKQMKNIKAPELMRESIVENETCLKPSSSLTLIVRAE